MFYWLEIILCQICVQGGQDLRKVLADHLQQTKIEYKNLNLQETPDTYVKTN